MDEAPNIDVKLGQGGRLVYDKTRRTIVAENLPCPICNGIEGCDHMVPERAAKALVRRFEHESMALHRTQREWLEREIAVLVAASNR